MPNANISTEILEQPQLLLAAETRVVSKRSARITAGGSRNLRLDIYCGVANAGTATLQHSSGYNMWSTVKTATLPTQAGTTATVDAATDIVSSTSHGLIDGQPFVMTSSGKMPNPLIASNIYYAQYINANSFKVTTEPFSSAAINLIDAGSGTLTVCPLTVVSIQLNVEVAADQAVMPLKSECRLQATGAAGDTNIVSARLMVEN